MNGERREPIWMAILPLLTCGIWMHVWIYQSSEELRRHCNDTSVNPGLDIVFGILTCGIYYWYAVYRNTKLLHIAYRRAGMPVEDRTALYVLLMIFFYPVTLYLFQEELNKLWAHGAPAPASYRTY